MGEKIMVPAGGLPSAARALLVPENVRAGVHIKGGGVDVVGAYISCYYLGVGRAFDLTILKGYENLTVDDFIVEPLVASGNGSGNSSADWYENKAYVRCNASSGVTKTYDSSTGQLTCKGYVSWSASGGAGSIGASTSGTRESDCRVYLVTEAMHLQTQNEERSILWQ